MNWDRDLFWRINHLSAATGWAHPFMAAYALWAGLSAIVIVWAAALLTARRRDDALRSVAAVLITGAAAVIALGINQLIAPAVGRARPFVAMPHVLILLKHSTDPSFPSDHAMIAGAFVGGLLLIHRRWGVLAAILALVLAFARVYAGMHYPTDVLAGLLIGAAIAVILVTALRTPASRLLRPIAGTPLRPLLTATLATATAPATPTTPGPDRAPRRTGAPVGH